MAALLSGLSAQTSPLDQAIAIKQTKQKKSPAKTPKVYKIGGGAKNKNDGPTRREQEILATIAKYPEIVAQILQEGMQSKHAEQKISWAKGVKENLDEIKEKGIHFGGGEETDVSVLMIIDFLCHHCQTHLKLMSKIRQKNANVNFIVYSVPLFQGDLTREYGLILNAAYHKDATKFLNLLGVYAEGKPSKEALLKKVQEFKIDIQKSDYSDIKAYGRREDVMEKIGLTQVPVTFALLNDKKGGTIVIPLSVGDEDSLVQTLEAMENTSVEERTKIKESLGQ